MSGRLAATACAAQQPAPVSASQATASSDATAETQDPAQDPAARNSAAQSTVKVPAAAAPAIVSTSRIRAAEGAYLAGAKQLNRDDLDAANRQFARAMQLDPANPDYALAITITREHKVSALVQQAAKARSLGDTARSTALLAQARAIDPQNPVLLEHSAALLAIDSQRAPQGAAAPAPRPAANSVAAQPSLTERARLLAGEDFDASSTGASPSALLAAASATIAGPIELKPAAALKSFHQRADAQQLLRQVAAAYGIRVVFDDSVDRKSVRLDLDDVSYAEAMSVLTQMAHVFVVPLDPDSALIARDSIDNRQRLERQLQETIYVQGATPEKLNEVANVVRTIFDVKQAVVQTGDASVQVRAPEATLIPLNRTIADLTESTGEIMLQVKLYEVDTLRTRNVGGVIPTQAGIYNVDAAATALVTANQSLVQQAIAQGFITASASNIEIALALIASGLVKSSLLSSTVGFFGKGLTETGITASTNTAFNLSLNSSDTRALDDIQLRVEDGQAASFLVGTRYPITTSTYTTGVSTPASSLSNATVNGVSVASLLSQYAGGSAVTIPQVTYENLGVTLKATPAVQKSGRISLLLDLKIEALAGGSSNGIPILASHQFTSRITVGEGESALLASNLSRTESSAVSGIPGLSELPGFQMPLDQNAEKDTGQLIVLITPHVVHRPTGLRVGPMLLVNAARDPAPVNQ